MKPSYIVAVLTAVIFSIAASYSNAMSIPSKNEITISSKLNTICIPHNGGKAYLHLDIAAHCRKPKIYFNRRPMNISVVLDRSGSMADERKIDYAKQAVISLIDQLSSEDLLSIVIYDDQIETLLPTQRVKDKRYIKRLVREVFPRGSTNLGGGMINGFEQVESNLDREYINRVILLSDGLANQGITDPSQLNRIANRYRSKSISLTTMGVGLDYNENLMLGLAESGGGNYYFIESPRQLASIFEKELHGLFSTIAQNARIELTLGYGVSLGNVLGYKWLRDGSKWIIQLGDLYSDNNRELILELNIPEGMGRMNIAKGTLKYNTVEELFVKSPSFSIDIKYSDDIAELEKGKDWDTQAKVDIAVSSSKVDKALKAYDSGNREEAEKELKEAKSVLLNSSAITKSTACSPAMEQQIKQLDDYTQSIKDKSADTRQVKKSIQYNNYKTQKGRN